MSIEIINPKVPNAKIPIAETFVMVSNSFFVGFLNACHTLLHLVKNDFVDVANFIKEKSVRGF